MEIIENQILKFRTRNPEKYSLIPKSQNLGEIAQGIYEVAVYWGLHEVRVLRNLGVKNVPSPIQGNYNWPGRHKPFTHQIQTASFLTLNNRAYCLNEPGTGKSAACLWASDYLMKIGHVNRVLIVCPLSIMEAAWMKDIMSFVIHRKAVIAHASSMQKRKDLIKSGTDYVIINYDGVEGVIDTIKDDGTFDLVILDEVNLAKNSQTRRWKSLNAILKPDTRVWALTGTPAPQSPLDAYGVAKLVTPNTVPKFLTAWRDRTMLKATQFKWLPKPEAPKHVHAALQPAVRFTKEMCLDLPPILTTARKVPMTPQQEKYYRLMKMRAVMEAAGETITAVNAATVINKLLQISCIKYDTPVLTDSGWVPIFAVPRKSKIWDGQEWVFHDGSVFKGIKDTLVLDGVSMTPEHRVLTNSGWATAKECLDGKSSERFSRPSVRLPNSYAARRHNPRDDDTMCSLGMSVRMRHLSSAAKSILAGKASSASEKLWVPHGQRNPQNVLHTSLQNLARDEAPLLVSARQRLQKLQRAGHSYLRILGKFFREFLGRYAERISRSTDAWAPRQRWGLLPAELSLGDDQTTIEQYAGKCVSRNAKRTHDNEASCRGVQYQSSYAGTASSEQMAASSCADGTNKSGAPVYDILNCGPRNRFVIRGKNGELLIVHNCGAVYSDESETVMFDCKPRLSALDEILEETSKKVIVFAAFRSSIDTIAEHLTKSGVTNKTITGDVNATKRGVIFNDYQTKPDPRVLVIQPQAAAHGVTLTEADTVIFWGPVTSVETYLQCIARAHRIGQKGNSVTVVHLYSSEIEAKMFKQLEGKVENHSAIVKLYDDEMKNL